MVGVHLGDGAKGAAAAASAPQPIVPRTTTLNQLVRWGGQEGLLDYTSRQLDGLKYCCEFLDESLPWHTSSDHRKFYEDLERILGDIMVRRQAAAWACEKILTGANPRAGQRRR